MMRSFRASLRRTVQAYSASIGITFGALSYTGFESHARQRIAIEQVQPELPFGVFDPREVVARRVILTVPIGEVATGERLTHSPN